MTQYVINIGALPNDGTGDPLRTAFNEVNLNFNQVWATGLVGSNVQIANNTILTTNTNGNLVLNPNGIGNVVANAHVIPDQNRVRNLGSSTQKWNNIYTQYISISGDATVAGNLSVAGNIIQVGNIVTDALTIQLANTAGTANAANGAGITVGANDDIATILYNSAGNVWTTNIGLSASGNVTAPYFIGDGSQLTNLPVTDTGNIGFVGDTIYDLYGIFLENSDLSHGATAAVAIPSNGNTTTPIQINNTYGNIVLQAGSNANITSSWAFNNNGILNLPPNAPGAASTEIKYGLGNLIAWNDGGWTIGEYNGTAGGTEGIRINPDIEGPADISLPANQLANTQPVSISNFIGNVTIQTGDGISTSYQWKFAGQDGSLICPGNLVITGYTNVGGSDSALIQANDDYPLISLSTGANGSVSSVWVENYSDVANSNIAGMYAPLPGTGNVRIVCGNNATTVNFWDFNSNGSLTLPATNVGGSAGEAAQFIGTRKIIGGINQTNPYSVALAAGGNATVAYTASNSTITSVKVTFAVQSSGGGFQWEQFDVVATISQDSPGDVNFVVSNRVKAASGIGDTTVTATMNGSNQIEISLTLDPVQNSGGTASFDAVEFGLMID